MKNVLKSTFVIAILSLSGQIKAQDDLLNSLDKEISDTTIYTAYTFKSTHIINGHSVENMKANQLDFRINHRFDPINSGAYEFFGLDAAQINFSLDYGLTDKLMIGARRGSYDKTYDGSVKYILFRQSTGKVDFPVSISYFGDMSIVTLKDPNTYTNFNQRLAYTHQILIARKFNEKLSMQITPSYVHRNQVNFDNINDIESVGIGGRYKFFRRVALTWEYFYSPQVAADKTHSFNPLALGFDIETGGHVFQLFVTNSQQMVENGVLANTQGDFRHGGLYLGFNISRVFAFGKKE
jgi:hypothetical protein